MCNLPREYIDSFYLQSSTQLDQFIQFAQLFGYSELWISGFNKKPKEKGYPSLRVFLRLNLGENNETKEQLATILSKQRRNFSIISINCNTPDIAAWASQDNRVDLVTFPVLSFGKLMTRSVANLMLKFEKTLEISLASIYRLPERLYIPAFRQLAKALDITQKKHIPTVFNSGAKNIFEIRSPKELISLFQLVSNEIHPPLDGISDIPMELRKRNMVKISPDYVSPGIYRIYHNFEEE
ncbi:MAG: hypothetical protein EAX86_00130 [Candidatus Heimdallarchaeota archaeon]|nr:hypothetical protein [Candidatus Heimdallarchaeota archaeon]